VILFRRSLDLGFRRCPRLENEMTAVERILEYTKQGQEYKCGVFVEDWLQRGEIQFSDVYFSYDSSNYVLHNLNFTIEPQQVVAVVGRTASGKSSMISALLRMYKLEGKIFIDGVDVATLPLDTLRSNVSVIAQDLVFFTGTVRENIDLTGKYTDEEIWNAMRTVNLKKLFSNLDHRISSAEANFSLGQKQLLCLARAIVRNNKIIIIDEVAAHMDRDSEEMIFRIVREKFSNCTVLMITHKLDYIRECDKVMVLDNGRIVDYDCPSVLLNDQNGLLYRMFKKAF
jgi:ATP-binding cassette subfamily C (CFTR/MRP) protein 4